jgi:hypothetical protein
MSINKTEKAISAERFSTDDLFCFLSFYIEIAGFPQRGLDKGFGT